MCLTCGWHQEKMEKNHFRALDFHFQTKIFLTYTGEHSHTILLHRLHKSSPLWRRPCDRAAGCVSAVRWAQCCQGNVGRYGVGRVGRYGVGRVGRLGGCGWGGIVHMTPRTVRGVSGDPLSCSGALVPPPPRGWRGEAGGWGGGADSFWVSGFSPPTPHPRNPLLFICAHTHTQTLTALRTAACAMVFRRLPTVALCSNRHCGRSRVLLPLFLPPPLSLPPFLTCLNHSRWMNGLLFLSHLSAVLTLAPAVGIIRHSRDRMCSDVLCLALHLLSSPITCLVFPHPCSLAQTVSTWLNTATTCSQGLCLTNI